MSHPATVAGLALDEQQFLRSFPCPLIPTNLDGAYAVPTPSTLLDPLTASADELKKNGIFWPRPTETDHPALRAAWHRVYAGKRKIEWVTPKLEPQPGKTHLLRKPAKQATNANFLTTSWSGAVIRDGGPWNQVFGQWIIPTVSVPPEPQGTEAGWNSSSWVGIDGFNTSNDVLQAGVEQRVDAQGNPSYVAWFEWFAPQTSQSPNYIFQINVPSVPVSPGDLVYCFINYLGSFPFGTLGNLLFVNVSTNQGFAVVLVSPPGAMAVGDTIEWIMEAPDFGEPTSSLPRFTPVFFMVAVGKALDGSSGIPGNGDTTNIVDSGGKILTSVDVFEVDVVIDFIG